MATLDMQNTAQLAESRRKMQSKRRIKNRIALTLSMATMAFGLFWLIWILMSTITRGIDGMSLALFTEMTPPPNTAGGSPGSLKSSALLTTFCFLPRRLSWVCLFTPSWWRKWNTSPAGRV